MSRLFLPLLTCVFLLSSCAEKPENNTSNQPAQPLSRGQQLFLGHCVSCHQGAGEIPGPNAVVLNSTTLNREETFRALLRQPASPMMRAFSVDELSDADVHELYGYLMGLRQNPAQ